MAPVMIWERKKERKKNTSMEDTVGRWVLCTFPRRGKYFVLMLIIDDDTLV
jgi:hypothetical protein